MKTSLLVCRLPKSQGAVLLLAMVFQLMLAMLAVSVVQTALLQLRMAGNDQFFEEAFHQAQAIATELSIHPGNFLLEGGEGYSNCAGKEQRLLCDRRLLAVPASAVVPPGVELEYRVIRQGPLLWRNFPIREAQDKVSSSSRFDAASFEIDVRISGSGRRLGNAHIVQGIALRVSALR